MKFKNSFISSLLALLSLPIYQSASQATTPIPINGLSPGDPRAKLDPSLKNVPDMPEPVFSPRSQVVTIPGQSIEIDLKTKSVLKSVLRRTSVRSGSPQFTEGNFLPGSKVIEEKNLPASRSVIFSPVTGDSNH